LFKRTRYQHGSVEREERKKGADVWVYRWWEEDINGKLLHRKLQIGDVETYPNESAAHAAADALRLTINNGSKHKSLQRTTISILWEHYSREELPRKALSTQDSYSMYAKNWIVPRWGNMQLDQIKTVEVERWLLATEAADGTQAKIKCVMSALFSHAVRWEFCGHNPISSGIPVGSGGKRGPSTGVRVSAKRRRSPLKLTAEQVALVLTELEFRDQLLVFLDAGLGTRRGELGALRWMDCDFNNRASTSNIPITGVGEGTSSIPSRRLRLSRCRCTPGSKMAFWSGDHRAFTTSQKTSSSLRKGSRVASRSI